MNGHAGLGPSAGGAAARRCRRSRRGDRGQATVELAVLLPVVVLLAMVVAQVGVLAQAQLLVHGAAREGARAAAVSPADGDARAAAGAAGGLDPGRLQVSVRRPTGGEGLVEVDVHYVVRTDLPLAGALLPDVTVSAHAAMRSET